MLSRIKELFHHHLMPKTPEQEIGLWMLIMAILTIPRPYAFALQTLLTVYKVQISPEFLGAHLAVAGAYLIGRKRVGRLVFVFLFAPAILYAFLLTWAFASSPFVGVLGSGYAVLACYKVVKEYAREATRRELELEVASDR